MKSRNKKKAPKKKKSFNFSLPCVHMGTHLKQSSFEIPLDLIASEKALNLLAIDKILTNCSMQ